MSHHYDYLVIGGGSGGLAAARRAASYGARTALIEKHRLGGTCVNVGCVPKKVMWNAAGIADALHYADDYGFELTVDGFDWGRLKQARDAYIERLNGIYRRNLEASKVDEIHGFAQFTGRHAVMVNGESYTADHILIAVGNRPLVPAIPGADLGITSDGLFELTQQPKNVAIIGAGYTAAEFAGLLNALGSSVTLLLRGEALLRRFDASLRDTLMEQMQADGINMLTCIHLQKLERVADGTITLVGGAGENITGFDTVIWAVGREPNIGGLGLEHTGVKLDEHNHIVTDEYQNTNTRGIYAVGDVTGRVALTPVAIAAARRLADRLFDNQLDARLDYANIPSVVFSHPPIGTVGMSEEDARNEFGDSAVKVYQSRFTNMFFGISARKQPTVVKLVTVGVDEKIVGCHVIGHQADEIIQGFAVAVTMGATKKDFDNTVAIHPTAGEELVTLR